MYCVKKVSEDITWIGGNDRRLSMFEGVYSVPKGVSYNAYFLEDEKLTVFDTVDKAVSKVYFENLEYLLQGRKLDYVIVSHMEPDHSATLAELVLRHPEVTIVCSFLAKVMIGQYFTEPMKIKTVDEGDTLSLGKHQLTFYMAPMVHWPEVMVSYESTEKILFSADAFGTFGALNGALFADEVDFDRDYLDEARRYYTNIVGKYGPQVQDLLKKAATLDLKMIAPLHGYTWRKNLDYYFDKYNKWSLYQPEDKGCVIAYSSIYGNTENLVEILAAKLNKAGLKTEIFDVSVTPASDIISAIFRYDRVIFAATTYNMGIFVKMEDLLRDLMAHNIQNRKIGLIQNGSWAPKSGKLMKDILSTGKDLTILEPIVMIKSSLKEAGLQDLNNLVKQISE